MGSEYSGGWPNLPWQDLGTAGTIRVAAETSDHHQHFLTFHNIISQNSFFLLVRAWRELIALPDNCTGEELGPSSSLGKKRSLSLDCHTLLLTH